MSDTTQAAYLANKSRLVEQASAGPSLHDSAARMLRDALKKQFPGQQIDPDKAVLMWPSWHQQGDEIVSTSSYFESLTHTLKRMAFTQKTASYIEGEHFLTGTPNAPEPIHLPVSMDAVTSLLNECAPVLFCSFAQDQLDYWNETSDGSPRWQALSDTLRTELDVQSASGWDTEECSLGRLVSQHPDKTSRASSADGLSNIRACLLDLDLASESAGVESVQHLMVGGALVLTATAKDRELIVMYSISDGYESFSSMSELGASLPSRLNVDLAGRCLRWRLFEPEGNAFDAMVWALVSAQVDAIEALDPGSASPLTDLPFRQEQSATDTGEKARIEQLENAAPAWLANGSLDDIQAYSGYMTELGKLRDGADKEAFDASDIPLIQTYAEQQMHEAILADETVKKAMKKAATKAAELRLDDIRITVTHSFEAGGFTLPDPRTVSVETLGEFAMHNTRPYSATVAYSDGATVPDWMKVGFLLRMANEIDVGKNYPKLIKSTLIDDTHQARRHRTRYRLQLPVLLPLLALECKLKRRGNVDESGYQQVCALMKSIETAKPFAEWPVQIRPLAFMPRYRLGHAPDTVANMYIIGPKPGSSGPCLLYRPLLDQPLRQFPSEQNMLYAFYQSGELRDSILAWLATRALSFEYAQYVFASGIPSPWTISELAFEPFIHLDLTAPVGLANTPLKGDILAALHDQNSMAVAELADRQSTSNGERRWALLADSGWAIFSVATNFLSGPAGTAVWVWQCIGQIQQGLDAAERGDSIVQWTSIGDVLLTLGILLTQRVSALRIRHSNPYDETPLASSALSDESPLITVAPAKAVAVTHDAAALTGELPEAHLASLSPSGLTRSSASAQFIRKIDQLKVPAPSLPIGATPNADHLHEVQGKRYAQVGTRWFQVRADADEPVYVIDPDTPSYPGIGLKFDAKAGSWHWDLELRLRGGGPTGRIAALHRERLRKKDEAWARLHRFIEQEAALQATEKEVVDPLESDDPSAETIANYVARTDELANAYGRALTDLETWREAGGAGVFYQAQLILLTCKQHLYRKDWIRAKSLEYEKIVKPRIDQAQPVNVSRAEQMRDAQRAIHLGNEMRDSLGPLHASIDRLRNHNGTTRKVADHLKKALSDVTECNLKANEVGLSAELSLRAAPDNDLGPIRRTITDIIEDAAEAGHSLDSPPISEETGLATPLSADQLTGIVDRLADAERRLEDLANNSAGQLEPVRFKRVQELVAEFHQLARDRLLKLLPEEEEIPVARMARLEPVPSTSRVIGKVTKSRPRILETQKASAAQTPEPVDDIAIVKIATRRRPVQPAALSDGEIVANGLALTVDLDAFIDRTRADAQRPARIPADMKDLLDQQATRLDQAATAVADVYARKAGEFGVASLSAELQAGATKARREGVRLYGAMLIKRRPRETYLKWLMDHDLVTISKDPRGRIKTKQRQDYFQEYGIFDKTHQNKPLWVAHFHYKGLTDPDAQTTAAHLKFADEYLKELPAKTRQELNTFDALDNALRRVVNPAIRDLFLKAEPPVVDDA